ncbi:MAG: helix-turn-helix transcriptional regulator [Blautia coccoides]
MKGLLIELAYNYFGQFANYEYKCMSLLNMILYGLHTYVPKKIYTDSEMTARRHRQERMSRITDYIEKNFRQKLLLKDIADHENLSLTYLSHLFRDELNLSFQEYLNLKRFEYACRLLQNTDKKVLTVSIESGFSDVRYLNQLCQKYYNCPASELRQKRKEPARADRQAPLIPRISLQPRTVCFTIRCGRAAGKIPGLYDMGILWVADTVIERRFYYSL